MTCFNTIDELAEYIIDCMKDDDINYQIFEGLFGYNVEYIKEYSTADVLLKLKATKKKLIPTLPMQTFYGQFYTDRSMTMLHIDLFVISEGQCVYVDIKFNDNFEAYEIIYSDGIEDIMKDTGKNIYEFDETDWDIVKFRTTINENF